MISTPVFAAVLLVAVVLVFLLTRYLSAQATPKVVDAVKEDAWAGLTRLALDLADSSHDQQEIAAAQGRMATRAQRLAAFQAKVGTLGAAPAVATAAAVPPAAMPVWAVAPTSTGA